MFSEPMIRNLTTDERTQYIDELPLVALRETCVELARLNQEMNEQIKSMTEQLEENEAEIYRLDSQLSELQTLNPEAA